MPAVTAESPRHIPIQECNIGRLEIGDVITVPSPEQIDLAAAYIGTQMMMLCGAKPVLDTNHPGLFATGGHAKRFHPLSRSLLLGMEKPLVGNVRFNMVVPVLGHYAAGVLQPLFATTFIGAVDLQQPGKESTSVLSQNIRFLGYPDRARLLKNTGPTSSSPTALAKRLGRYGKVSRPPVGDPPAPEFVDAIDQLITTSQGLFA